MIKKLIVLADVLDTHNHREAADFVDELLKSAKGDEDLERIDEWEEEPVTKVDREPTPAFIAPLPAEELEHAGTMSSMEMAAKLRDMLRRAPNPESWDEALKISVLKLMDRLRETL